MTNLHSAFRDQTLLSKINAFTRMTKTACLVCFDLGIHFRSRDGRGGRRPLQTTCFGESEVRCLKRHRRAWSWSSTRKKILCCGSVIHLGGYGKTESFKICFTIEETSIFVYRHLRKNKEKVRPKGESKGG